MIIPGYSLFTLLYRKCFGEQSEYIEYYNLFVLHGSKHAYSILQTSTPVIVAASLSGSIAAIVQALFSSALIPYTFGIYALFIVQPIGYFISLQNPKEWNNFRFYHSVAMENMAFTWKNFVVYLIGSGMAQYGVLTGISWWLTLTSGIICVIIFVNSLLKRCLNPVNEISKNVKIFQCESFSLPLAYSGLLLLIGGICSHSYVAAIYGETDDSISEGQEHSLCTEAGVLFPLILTYSAGFVQILPIFEYVNDLIEEDLAKFIKETAATPSTVARLTLTENALRRTEQIAKEREFASSREFSVEMAPSITMNPVSRSVPESSSVEWEVGSAVRPVEDRPASSPNAGDSLSSCFSDVERFSSAESSASIHSHKSGSVLGRTTKRGYVSICYDGIMRVISVLCFPCDQICCKSSSSNPNNSSRKSFLFITYLMLSYVVASSWYLWSFINFHPLVEALTSPESGKVLGMLLFACVCTCASLDILISRTIRFESETKVQDMVLFRAHCKRIQLTLTSARLLVGWSWEAVISTFFAILQRFLSDSFNISYIVVSVVIKWVVTICIIVAGYYITKYRDRELESNVVDVDVGNIPYDDCE